MKKGLTMKKGRFGIYLLATLLLGGCCNQGELITKINRDAGGYYYYGCCHYGYYNNPDYERGGPCNKGCYNIDCSSSMWR